VPQIFVPSRRSRRSAGLLDGEKAQRELGFHPEVSVDEAIARALKWFQGNGLVKSEIKS
jgi:nucleoside-diphosphate-sugar epimerase